MEKHRKSTRLGLPTPVIRLVGGGLAWASTASMAVAQDGSTNLADPQEGFDAHGFNLVAHDGDLRDPLTVQRPGPFSQGDFFLGGLAEYAKSPLVLVQEPEQGDSTTETQALDNVVALNLSLGVAAHDYLRFDVTAPVYFVSSGVDPADITQTATEGPAMGDIRANAMLMVLRPEHTSTGGGFGFGLVGNADIPSGTPTRFLGQGGVAGGGGIAMTYEFPVATLSGHVGTLFAPRLQELADATNLVGGPSLNAGVGIGALASDTVGLNVEFNARPPFEPVENVLFPAELLASLKYKDENSGAFWTFGGATGLTTGPGVAAFRLFVGGGFARMEPPAAPDFDPIGSLVVTDECPLEDENVNGWKDDDGCPDDLKALAIEARFKGQPWTAEATITGPDGVEKRVITPAGHQVNAVPGTSWAATAQAEGCLYGEASAVASEGGAAMTIHLEPRYDAHVQVEVVGPDDRPLPTAQIIWTSDTPHCIPQGMMMVSQSGVLDQDISSGSHRVTVTAPNHSVYEEDVLFAPGDNKLITVKLTATRIEITKRQIKILEKVHFETDKAIIKPESFGLLSEVALTILDNPQLGRVEVAGHTDSRGSDAYNEELSRSRAASVRDYLIGKGVAADQLIAAGYGETRPIDTNKTPEGREKNRRVEFNLLDAPPDDQEGGGQAP